MVELLIGNWLSIVIFIIIFFTIALKIGQWVGGINSDREKFLEAVEEIRKNMRAILERLPMPSDNDRR